MPLSKRDREHKRRAMFERLLPIEPREALQSTTRPLGEESNTKPQVKPDMPAWTDWQPTDNPDGRNQAFIEYLAKHPEVEPKLTVWW